jgi:acyl carrier protein
MAGNHVNTEIREFILDKFPLARRQKFGDSDGLLESGILDSLGVLDLVTFLEQKFSIGVADDELTPDNFQSIDKLSAFVQRKSSHGQ